jgi:hypothetical protein
LPLSKDENGRLKTEEYRVEGPSAIFLATTAIDVDEELQNRCLILTVDESREQTQAIHGLQRGGDTFEGLKTGIERKRILDTHRNAQRLLRTIHVVNPFAPFLTFPSERTRARRDHTKYLALIRTIALLHQYQRQLKRTDGIEYIEVELSDIAAANRIAHEALGRSLDELPPQTRRLLGLLQAMVKERCEARQVETPDCLFTRREVRERIGWSDTQLKVHLSRLVDMEYLATRFNPRHSQSYLYELIYDVPVEIGGKHLPGLIEIDELKRLYDENRSGQKPNRSGENANRSALGRGPVGGRSKGESDASRSSSGGNEPDAENGEKDKGDDEKREAS